MADLTIGFSTYEDYDGAVFTLDILRAHHKEAMKRCEIVVVDQTDQRNRHAKDLLGYMNGIREVKCKYASLPEPLGTSPGRHALFDLADTPYVLCVDGHIDVFPDSLEALLRHYDEHPDTKDMLHGQLVHDDHKSYYSHMEVVWRQGMLGIWGMMWKCPSCGRPFVVQGLKEEGRNKAIYLPSPVPKRWVKELPEISVLACVCGMDFPELAYEGHEPILEGLGFVRPGDEGKTEPFEIPAHGLGMFSCSVKTWKEIGGFNSALRGFGGEECYIHEKIKRNGGKTMCLPSFRWWHRFGRPGGAPYTIATMDKMRNNVITHQELGWNPEDVHKHFTTEIAAPERNATEEQWQAVLRRIDVSQYPRHGFHTKRNQIPQTQAKPRRQMQHVSIDHIFNIVKAVKRDLDQHMDTLKEYASRCEHVTELSKRKESTVALLAGRPVRFVSYNLEGGDPIFEWLHYINNEGPEGPNGGISRIDTFDSIIVDSLQVDPSKFEETDLLFIDTFQNAERLREELKRFLPKVRRYLVIHDTSAFGEFGDNQKEGLNFALREMVAEHPEWKPVFYTPQQYGLTILSKNPQDHPPTPVVAWKEAKGPGSELKKILLSLDIPPNPNCDCNAKAAQMDAWGVQGCKDNFETIVGWMRDGAPKWGWKDKVHAAAKAVTTGLVFHFNPLDPFPGIITEAIRRAEEKEKHVVAMEFDVDMKSPNYGLPKTGAKWIEKPKEEKPAKKAAKSTPKSRKKRK